MKRILTSLLGLALVAGSSNAQQVWINEILTNPNGSDTGNEYFELRGTPGMSLAGYCLVSVEGEGASKGDINSLFFLDTFSLGANGYLFARQAGSRYTATAPGATVIQNTAGTGWGLNGSSTVGYWCDTSGADIENDTSTILLVNVASGGTAPLLTIDLDTDNNGTLDLPSGWSVVDSVGIMDGSTPYDATDLSYGAITLRVGGAAAGTGSGAIVDVPGSAPTSAGAFYAGRRGESTGSTGDDWFGAILNGSAADPLNIIFASVSDSYYHGLRFSDMVFGGPNPIPEPGTLTLLGLGALALFLRRRSS